MVNNIAMLAARPADQAYKLAWVLTGKDLSEGNLKPLVAGLLQMLESAAVCRDRKARLQSSEDFRRAGESTWLALRALGVSESDGQIVMGALFRGAQNSSLLAPRLTYK